MRRATFAMALGALSLAVSAAEAPAPASTLSVESFFREGVFEEAVLSPSGNLVLAVTHPDVDHRYVTVIDLKTQTSTDVVASAQSDERFAGLNWTTDDIASFDDRLPDGTSHFVVMDWNGVKDGKPSFTVTRSDVGAFSVRDRLMRDGRHILVTRLEGKGEDRYLGLYRVDPIGGPGQMTPEARLMKLDQHTAVTITDKNGDLRMIMTRDEDGTRHYFSYAGQGPDGVLWHEFKRLQDETAVFSPFAFAPDGKHLYVRTNLGRNTIGLVEYDPASDQVVRTIFSSEEGDVTSVRYDLYSESIIFLNWTSGATLHYEVLDPRAGNYMPTLQRAFPGKRVVPWGVSRDGRVMLVYIYSDTDPGSYYVLNTAAGEAELLSATRPWLDSSSMAAVHQGAVQTHDGFSINYLLTLPTNGKGPYPLVVIPHGGPIGIFDFDSFDSEAQLLASRGYAVLKVNYRGSGGNGEAFLNAGKRQWGRKIEDDILESVNDVLHTQPIDRERVCVYGASYGGYSALMSVIRDPALFKCAASFAGVTDIPLMYDSSIIQYSAENRRVMADLIGDPTTDAAALRAVSPVYLTQQITRPVFLAQGGEDTRVDPEQAYRLKLVLDRLGKDVEFQYYPHDGHGFSNIEDEVDFYTRLLQFLDANIGAGRTVKAH